VQVLEVAREMGLLKIGTVALDGTKIHASDPILVSSECAFAVGARGASGSQYRCR
jgi:hypothetical protein